MQIINSLRQKVYIKRRHSNYYFMARVLEQQALVPKDRAQKKAYHAQRMAAVVADHVDAYFDDMLALPVLDEGGVLGVSMRLAKRIKNFHPEVKRHITGLCLTYIDRLTALQAAEPDLSPATAKLHIRQWLGERYDLC